MPFAFCLLQFAFCRALPLYPKTTGPVRWQNHCVREVAQTILSVPASALLPAHPATRTRCHSWLCSRRDQFARYPINR